jgi:hypothetical protein
MPSFIFYLIALPLLGLASTSCSSERNPHDQSTAPIIDPVASEVRHHEGNTIQSRFVPPEGFHREQASPNSFANYLRNLPLKPEGSLVHYFDGSVKPNQNIYSAVVDIDVGNRDLQQCADAIMRLRAEWLYAQKQYDEISFTFNNGFVASYARWRQGERIRVSGNQVSWYAATSPTVSYTSFRKYLTMVFAYAGTAALEQDLKPRPMDRVEIGDVLIQGGSPGHAVIVVDKVVHSTSGAVRLLLAQSYMPAQDIQILQVPGARDHTSWYEWPGSGVFETPEWVFKTSDLRFFPDLE